MSPVARFAALAFLLITASTTSAKERLILVVTIDRRPASGLIVSYRDLTQPGTAVADRRGVAMFNVTHDPGAVAMPYMFELRTADYVLANPPRRSLSMARRRSPQPTWLMRRRHRACDEWLLVRDVPRGTLKSESADELERWYSSLSPQLLANCKALTEIERRVGSPAPWYLYELKSMPQACVAGEYVGEMDWAGWYRRLLEKATGAAPGKCVADWDRWWAQKGYPAIPVRPELKNK